MAIKKTNSLKKAIATVKKWYKKDENGRRNEVAITLFQSALFFPIVTLQGIKAGIYAVNTQKSNMEVAIDTLTMPFISVLKTKGNCSGFHNSSFSSFNPSFLIIYLLIYSAICIMSFIYKDRNKNLSAKKDGWMEFLNHDVFNEKHAYHNENGEIAEPDEMEKTPGNMILSKDLRFHLAGTPTTYSCALVAGAIGSGKTFTYVKPNILQMNSSYIVTDPKGELTRDCGKALMNNGYRVKVLNIDQDTMIYSCRYNPFKYIRDEESLISLVNVFLDNTNPDDKASTDPFFGPAEKNFYLMLFFYVYTVYKDKPEKQTFKTVYELYSMADESEQPLAKGQPPKENELDKKFQELAEKDPANPALGYYLTFKNGSPKTKQSILISAGIRLWFMSSTKVANLLSGDDMELETLGDRKTAVFVIMKAEDKTFNFIAAMFFTQLFNILYYTGNIVNEKSWLLTYGNCTALRSKIFIPGTQSEKDEYKALEKLRKVYMSAEIKTDNPESEKFKEANEMGLIPWVKSYLVSKEGDILETFNSRKEAEMFLYAIKHGTIEKGKKCLTCHTRFMLDEFYNIGKIPDFDKKLATFRSLRISSDIIVQSISQLKEMYEDRQSKITSNCSIIILLGANDIEDCKWFSEQIGQTTIKSKSVNIDNKGIIQGASGGSISDNSQDLMRPEAIRSMPGDQSLIIVQGQMPMKDKKYKAIEHPRWHETDEKFEYERLFYIEQKESAKPKIKLHTLNTRPVEQNFASVEDKRRMSSAENKMSRLKNNVNALTKGIHDLQKESNMMAGLNHLDKNVIKTMDEEIMNEKAQMKGNIYQKKSLADELSGFIDF